MYKVSLQNKLKLPNFLMGSVLISWGYFFFLQKFSNASVVKK